MRFLIGDIYTAYWFRSRARIMMAKLWKFINSAFGLWLLSTVVVGGFVSYWTEWQTRTEAAARAAQEEITAHRRADFERRARLRALHLEISSRFSQFLHWADVSGPNALSEVSVRVGVRRFTLPPNETRSACKNTEIVCKLQLFSSDPTFDDLSLFQLLVEATIHLRSFVRPEHTMPEPKYAYLIAAHDVAEYEAVIQLRDRLLHLEEFAMRYYERDQESSAWQQAMLQLYPIFTKLDAWKDLPYTDCSPVSWNC